MTTSTIPTTTTTPTTTTATTTTTTTSTTTTTPTTTTTTTRRTTTPLSTPIRQEYYTAAMTPVPNQFSTPQSPLSQIVTPCQQNICFNGGSCYIISQSGFICVCQIGFYGDMCQFCMKIFYFKLIFISYHKLYWGP